MNVRTNRAAEFTDGEYLNKKELTKRVGSLSVDLVWKEINDYRELFRFPVELKTTNNIPFTLCLTPSILYYFTTAERELFDYKNSFEKLDLLSQVTGAFEFPNYKKDYFVCEIQALAKYVKNNISKADLMLMIDSKLNGNQTVSDIILALQATIDYKNKFNSDLLIMINDVLEHNEGKLRTTLDGNFNPSKISDALKNIDELFSEENTYSPVLTAALVYGYCLYVNPFEKYSNMVGMIASLKVLDTFGFGKSVFYIKLIEQLLADKDHLNEGLKDTIQYGDFNYFVINYLQSLITAIDLAKDAIEEIPVPDYHKALPKVVEKIVQVPVEKIVEKIVEVPVNVKVEDDDDKDIDESYLSREYKKVKKERKEYDFIDDPFKEEKSELDDFFDMSEIIEPYINYSPNELAKELIHLNPTIKPQQAYFYANHHDFGKYYTISQFKEFANCVYETARTGMDGLVSLNLYKKEQIKNKYVYTPKFIKGMNKDNG